MAKGKPGEKHGLEEWSRSIQLMIDEMHKRTFVQFRNVAAWQPATNVYESDAAYHVCVDLAGLNDDQVHVDCVERRLVIEGARDKPLPEPPDQANSLSVHVMEIDEGPFRREITLPQSVDVDHVQATYRKGYLWILLPKTNP